MQGEYKDTKTFPVLSTTIRYEDELDFGNSYYITMNILNLLTVFYSKEKGIFLKTTLSSNEKYFKKSKLIFCIITIIYTADAREYLNEYFYNFYITGGIYIGYSSGAALGIGPKFSIGFLTHGYDQEEDNNYCNYYIANNITAGYIHHFGTVHKCREYLLELQILKMRYTGLFAPIYCLGAGAGISLFKYYNSEDSTTLFIRPRISAFAGNILFINASKTFGLPKEEGYTGFHIGGTAVIGFPFWLLEWD